MKHPRLRLVIIVLVLLVLAIAGCALAGGVKKHVPPYVGNHVTTTTVATTTTAAVQTVTIEVPGPPGAPGQTGATGATGAAGVGADLCPNWDGIQSKPPKGTVGTLNPRGQFVCVKLAQARAWHPLK